MASCASLRSFSRGAEAFEAFVQDEIEGYPAGDKELYFVPASACSSDIAFSECLAISSRARMTHDNDNSSHCEDDLSRAQSGFVLKQI